MLQKNNTFKIAKIFFENPGRSFHLRELTRIAKLSTTAVTSSLKELTGDSIIIKEKEKQYHVFTANREYEKFKFFKKFYTVKRIIESNFLDFLDKELNYPEAVILFGSAARGEDTEKSDIDIFILSTKKKELDLEMFEKILARPIKIVNMNQEEFEAAKKRNPEFVNNIINGGLLRGYLKVV